MKRILLIAVLLMVQLGFGQNRTSANTGNWSVASTWSNVNINRVGTISSLSSSSVVTGTGTSFLTELAVGSVITTQTGTTIGTVLSIASNTSLTLTANASNNVTNQSYRTTSGPPSPVDSVTILANHTVTVNGSFVCASLAIAPTNNNISTLNFASTGTPQLTVNGVVTLGNSVATNRRGALNMTNGGTLFCQGFVLANTGTNVFNSGIGTVNLTATNTLPSTIFTSFNNLNINSGTTTMGRGLTINGSLSVASGATANLGTFTHTAKFLVLGGTSYASQSWGSTSSPATNKRDDFFATTTGIVNVNAYCLPTASTVRTITFVSLNEIQNTSSGTTAYEDFTTSVSSANASRGSSFTLGVRGNTGTSNTHYFSVYFDWNQDGDFADSGEYIEIGTIRDSNGTDNNKLASVFFTVPSTAVLGLTRMRVINSSGGYSATDGCSINSSTGQAEDYLINITDLCSGTPVPGATASTNNPVCPNTPFTLSFSNPVVNGVQYTWESSLNGSSWIGSSANPINFFNTDFSTTPANSNVYGGNASITGGELILTIINENNNPLGGFKIQKTLASAGLPSINAFTTKFKYRAFDGTGADGISLSYGASLGDNPGPGEEGEGSGLRLCLDTYDNDGSGTGSRVRIYYNNSFIFQNRIGSYELRNNLYREVVLSVSDAGFLTLTIGGTTIVSGLSLPNYTAANKSNWNFKFSARTGGEDDKQSIDDIDIKYLDILPSNVLFTTQQTVATYYRVKATCVNGGGVGYSTPLLVNVDPKTPIIGTITQPTCALATGSVALSGLPSSGAWTITATPSTSGLTGLGGTGGSTIVGGLTANTSYTFVVSNGTCSSTVSTAVVVNAVPATATWNGIGWTGTTSSTTPPNITQPIIFTGSYTSNGDINGCSCTVTSGNVLFKVGHTLTITNAVNVTNNASTSLVFENNASLVQTTNATNTGAIEYRRTSSPMKNFDFTYWASPVSGQTAKSLSPNTLWDKYFRFSGSANDWVF
ncbi:GEVED domain-containing protein, partial [Flavobacterium sp.]|uniref:beta strand repeat-containing protein n=1 Tax=Flavobacterium sp. TaxID=239 RepID=UPI00262C6A5D